MITDALHSDEFVGRHGELSVLHREFVTACEGRVRFVLLEGEAGIGKSRLIEEFRTSLGDRAAFRLGFCSEQVRSPYLPFAQALDRFGPRLAPANKASRDAVASYGDDRWAYFNEVAETLRRASLRKPVVLAIEDVHWADSASLELVRFLLQRLDGARVLFVVTLRTEGVARQPGLTALRSTASRGGYIILQLAALRRNEIRYLVQQTLRRAQTYVDPAGISQIEMLAEGNPLFAEELARIAVQSRGELALRRNMPLSLQAILSERLAPFDESERETLIRAAVIGQSFDVDLLAAIAGRDRDHVLAVMQRSVDCELLAETGSPLHFKFRHELIRQALADQLVQAVASPLHVRVALALELREDARERAAELAYHWSSARVAEKARFWNEAAGEAAWNVYAYRDAIRFYSAALRWNYPPGRARAAIYERLGTLLYTDGCGDEPATWFVRCRQEYEAFGDAVGAARALLLLADQSWVDARTGESLRAGAEAAATLDRLGHTAMYGEAILGIARFSVTLGNPQQARPHLRAAARLAPHFDARSKAMLYEVRGEANACAGMTAEALADLRAASALAHESGSSELIAQVENNFGLAAVDLGEIDLALERHRIALDEAHRTDMMWRVAYCSLNYARALTLKGEFAQAQRVLRQAMESGATTATFKTKAASVGIPLALRVNDAAMLEACSGEQALQLAERSRETQRIAATAAAFAELYAATGRARDARELLGRALRAIPQAHRCWEFFLAVAQWGGADDIALARTMLAAAPGRPRVQRAYALLFAALAARSKDSALSKRAARAAAGAFRKMGDELHASIADDVQGKTHAAPAEPASASGPALTARQTEIAGLVAQGETNKGIAVRLGISEHTVEHHLSGIFERLGMRSRAQLANFMAREGAL